MDAEKKTEDSEQLDKAQEESSLPEAAPEDHSNKRKLSEAGDSDNDQNAKKMKMEEEEEEKQDGGDGGKDSANKEDTAGETEEDKDQKPDEKPSSPAGKEEVKDEGGDEEESAEPAEQSQQDDEAMDVEDSTTEKDTVLEEGKEEKEEKPQSAEKKESNEETKEEAESDKPEPKQASESEEKEEKTEVVQRRYPMRHRRGEDKAASQSAKASGLASDSKKSGSSGTSRDDDSHKGTRAGSVKSDSGSDKENMSSDMAGDMGNADTPDVIMLSEEEETEQSKEKKAKKRKLVRRLQAHLRNEEAKLVLLKKLRQSQLTPQVQDHTPVSNSSSNQLSKQATPRQQGGPPPLVRGGQQVRGSSLHLQQQQQQSRTPSQGQMRNMQGPPPLVVTPRMGSGNSGANGHGGQNLRNNTPHLNQHGSSGLRPVQQQQQQQATTPQHQQSATPPQVDTQTPAQRQAAAKLALRKQLEKTLLQIPPPKPPAPEMNFIPSLACPDFVLLLGLEEVVNHIIDLQLIARGQKSPDEKFICNPFTCVQCNTDYTPVWKREKPGSKNVICEHCVTWNQKRALKQEHTNRLKSAFVKALQQEQEIERMQAQTPSNPSTPTPTPSGTPPTSTSAPPQALAAAAAASNVAAAAAMSMNPASFRHSAEQVRQHHNFLQAQAQLRAGQPLPGLQGFGPRSTFPYNLPYVKQADLQRQYLLDLMPRTAGMPWKQ